MRPKIGILKLIAICNLLALLFAVGYCYSVPPDRLTSAAIAMALTVAFGGAVIFSLAALFGIANWLSRDPTHLRSYNSGQCGRLLGIGLCLVAPAVLIAFGALTRSVVDPVSYSDVMPVTSKSTGLNGNR